MSPRNDDPKEIAYLWRDENGKLRVPSRDPKPWIPWKGRDYDKTRLLLLGESAGSWRNKDGIWQNPSLDLPSELVEEVIEGLGGNSRFANCLSWGLAGEEWPSKEQQRRVWDRVAFTDFVNGTIGRGPGTRPTSKMWEAAKRAFPKLLAELKPQRVIVIGKTMWGWMPRTHVYVSADMRGYKLPNGEVAMCWALPHPSFGHLSWERLANAIRVLYPGGEFPGRFV